MSEQVTFDDLLHEEREFAPSKEFAEQAIVSDDSLYKQSEKDPLAFWEKEARELEWFAPWKEVMEWTPPHVKWFTNGRINLSHNCLDRHLKTWRRNKAAIIWEGENNEIKTFTYQQLHTDVCKFANAMKSLGVTKGTRVAIYMAMVPEAAIAMLACARIGAIHSVVFGGFSPESLSDRINDAQAELLITSDGGWRRGNIVPLKNEADKALENTPSIKNVVIVKRPHGEPFPCRVKDGRDHWYHRLMEEASADCPATELDSEDPLYTLYTSGTTGKPKGIVHTTGGYSVGTYATTKYVFDLKDEDIYWCTADVGWVTGHSYIVYGPLQCGATVLMYEGAPNYPENDRFWEIIERHRVSVFYTAPTAIRAFMKWGHQLPAKHDLSSLRLLGSVGEPINPEAWMWYHKHIGGGNCPIVDTWWQTETGSIMITTLPGYGKAKPGYAGVPFPGIQATILDEDGNEVESGSGLLAVTHPWPSMLRTIWGDDERFVNTYFSKWNKKIYFPGDGAKRDEKGNFMILGRVDDVLNVSGHRIGTMEVESALVDHHLVAEAAVVGRKHDLKGQAVVAFVTLKARATMSDAIKDELKKHVATKIGAIARPEEIIFAADLPKTRSGKIMRRLLRDIADGNALGDTTTLADPSVVEMVREQYEEKYGD
ncbi:MAG: acetyl-CoA synthetase [Candidatus Sumerlaeota bacterium]|nr:acetyl-CoA synthetase [Candidatus Sumerlaeota bacterium]